jgi:hypothetical protein
MRTLAYFAINVRKKREAASGAYLAPPFLLGFIWFDLLLFGGGSRARLHFRTSRGTDGRLVRRFAERDPVDLDRALRVELHEPA